MTRNLWPAVILALAFVAQPIPGAELILPQNRTAFYCHEAIEVAVAGLAKGASTTLEFVPDLKVLGLEPVCGGEKRHPGRRVGRQRVGRQRRAAT
jgi:hypothetical protein